MIGATVAVGRISVPGHDDLHAHFGSALHDGVEILYLKPQQDAVTVWPVGGVADRAMIVVRLKAVELENQLAV
jgi:hypothetical protein